MFKKDEFLTDDEKIDAIYRYVKRRRWVDILEAIWKWTIRISIISTLYYIYLHPSIVADAGLEKKFSTFISGLATPIAKDMMQSITGNNGIASLPATVGSSNASYSGGQCILMTNSGTLIMPDGREVPLTAPSGQ